MPLENRTEAAAGCRHKLSIRLFSWSYATLAAYRTSMNTHHGVAQLARRQCREG